MNDFQICIILLRPPTNMKNLKYQVLLNELVSVSFKDEVLGSIPKWDAHLNSYITKNQALPHRAFSIFLFNSENKLMFQRRSVEKKTFPLCWTNTCCSHPNMIKYEDSNEVGVEHIRKALHRALDRELKMDLTNQKFYLVDKILYKAEGREGEQFGEYEVDYVFLCKLNTVDVKYHMVPEEVCEVQWVEQSKMNSFLEEKSKLGCLFSPWFMKMFNNGLLNHWWSMAIKNELSDVGTEDGTPVKAL